MFQEWRHAADGADLALDVVERNVGLGRRIEFQDSGYLEFLLEPPPDIGAQPIAASHTQPMRRRGAGAVDKVSAQLADILKQRAVPIGDILPEVLRRELFAD